MSLTFKKIWSDYGIGAIVVLLIVAYGVNLLANYLSSKGSSGYESNAQMQKQYTNTQMSAGVKPAAPLGQNEVYSSVNGIQTSMPSNAQSCAQSAIQNPAELLPLDTNSQWAQLNPSGKGDLANINLLKAGYHIGIDTIGQTLRNANLQIRSEPPNPQLSVGPWNQSTIEPDFMRVPLEIGVGPQ
jgi:hypothetical protein